MTIDDLMINALSVDLAAARDECVALLASNAVLREMLHAALDQLHRANVTQDRMRDAAAELRRLRPIVKWVEDERREQGGAA